MNWIKITLLTLTISSLSLVSCKSSKAATSEENTVVTEKEVMPPKTVNENEVDKFKSKVKRLQSSISTGDYNSANSIVKQLNYDINREVDQTKDFMRRARLTPEGKVEWDAKLLLQTNTQKRMSTLRLAPTDSKNKIINVVKTLDAFVKTMN